MLFSYEYKKFCFPFFMGILLFPSSGCLPCVHREYPISSKVVTTHERTVVPVPLAVDTPKIFPYQLSKYKKYGYGRWRFGPGLPYVKRLDIMPSKYSGELMTHKANLLNFFVVTDVHIRDKESPAQPIYWGYKGTYPLSSIYSGTMLYTTQVFDAAVQTINALHKKSPFHFGMSLGDSCNATQYNELRWFIDVLDGKIIRPSSGDHVGEHSIPYQRPFKAVGLNKKIPWYQAIGNHDHFWYGFLRPNTYLRHTLVKRDILNLGNIFIDPRGANTRGYYMGAIDGSTPYGDIIGAGIATDFQYAPKVHAADWGRRSLSRYKWIREFFKTTSFPKGHGFRKSHIKTGFACYSFQPKSDVPLALLRK